MEAGRKNSREGSGRHPPKFFACERICSRPRFDGATGAPGLTVLFKRDVLPLQAVLVDPAQAAALQAPVRLAMLELLRRRPMAIDELAEELRHEGFRKAPNTLRHHLELLKKADLVELALLQQSRGAVLKFYAASARPFHHRIPPTSEPELERLANEARPALRRVIDRLLDGHEEDVGRIAGQLSRCPRCAPVDLTDFVVVAIVRRGTTEALRERHRSAPPGRRPGRPTSPRRPKRR